MDESHSPLDANDDELKQALAAFGDDAMDLLLNQEEACNQLLDSADPQCQSAVEAENPRNRHSDFDSRTIREFGIKKDDSSLIRYTKELANAIYCGQSMPHQENRISTSSAKDRCVVFTVSQQPFALPLPGVREIMRRPAVTMLPRTPAWLRGVTNVRGQIVSVIDLSYLLGLAKDYCPVSTEKAILIHNEKTNQSTSIVADRILGIRNLRNQQADLSDLTSELESVANAVASIDAGDVVLIDNDKLFELADLTALSHQQINT